MASNPRYGQLVATLSPSSSSSSSSAKPRWTYDVFLSFRGEDTRKNFTDHLYYAMRDAGINAFRDDNELRRGHDITAELLKAIQESRVSVIAFSANYAASRWCLEELVEILECRTARRQLVLPIFYDVDPSDVRKQRGSFAQAFAIHEANFNFGADENQMHKHKVAKWKAALTEAANLSGWDLSKTCDGHEAKFIKKIVAKILQELNNTYLHVANHPVGLDSRVRDMNFLLNLGGSNDDHIRIVGIWGMGGMGKTTIAKAVYNQFFPSFDGKCFLENVREISNRQPDGLIRLQEQLLSDILKTTKVKVGSVDRGISVIKERLCNRKVLVILDDVDHIDQLNAIARKRDWFGLGSRIIVTTRDEHLLKVIEADEIYPAEKLDDRESLELFSWHAFGKNDPIEDYTELSNDVISYSEGLPLALEVLGSFLRDKNMPEWKDALQKLKKIPHNQIMKKLRISIDALEDDTLRDIFLDIACFFIGMDKEYAITILDNCGLYATIGIGVLTRRCLVGVNEDNKLRMHDILRDMGREIVREESFKYPGNRSRMWFREDVLNVLEMHTGTYTIEGLTLSLPRSSEVQLKAEALAKMQKLRLLQLNYVRLTGDYQHLSKELRWLRWHGFPLKHIPNNFYQGNLVAIDMRYSNLRQVWKDSKVILEKLAVLNLSHSPYLTKTPDFSMLPNLEKLILKNCERLVDVHQSIGSLNKLKQLKVKNCPNLKNLPKSISKLKSVEILDLSGCSTIDQLPEDIGDMESLTDLLADETAIRQVPFSIVRLKNLRQLSLCGCKGSPSNSLPSLIWSWISPRKNPESLLLPNSLSGMSSLTRLCLKDCNLPQGGIPSDLGSLSSLEDLELSGNNFLSLPASVSRLYKLRVLQLDRCTRLQSLELPSNLKTLYADDCSSLEKLSNLSNFTALPGLFLGNCSRLTEVPGLEKLEPEGLVRMHGCNSLSQAFKETLLQEWSARGFGGIFFPGKEIPDWFSHQSMSSSLSIQLPLNPKSAMKGFAMCIVYAANSDYNTTTSEAFPVITVINRTKNLDWRYRVTTQAIAVTQQDHLWVSHLPLYMFRNQLYGGDLVDIKVDLGEGVTVNKCGIRLVYEQQEEQADHLQEADKSDGGHAVTKCSNSSNVEDSMVVEADDGRVSAADDPLGAHGKRGHEDGEDGIGAPSDGDYHQPPKRLRF